jgi:alkylhydroperoxidase/carboxymuconolactone decarboxylase family protein YurZ
MTNSTQLIHETSRSLTKITQELPEVMSHFSGLAKAATQDGAINAKVKALITLSLAIQVKSAECITYHVENVLKCKVSREEVLEVVTIAAYMGGGPALMAAEDALTIYDTLSDKQTSSKQKAV